MTDAEAIILAAAPGGATPPCTPRGVQRGSSTGLCNRQSVLAIPRGAILRGREFVDNARAIRGLDNDNTFLAGATVFDAMFSVTESGITDMRSTLVCELLRHLECTPSSAEVKQAHNAELPKYFRVPLDAANMERLRARARAAPSGPLARLLEVDAEIETEVGRSGTGTDFFVIAQPGCTPDSEHADLLLLVQEKALGRSRLVSKDAAGPRRVLCRTRFRPHDAHRDGRLHKSSAAAAVGATAIVPCGSGGGCSYASDAVSLLCSPAAVQPCSHVAM